MHRGTLLTLLLTGIAQGTLCVARESMGFQWVREHDIQVITPISIIVKSDDDLPPGHIAPLESIGGNPSDLEVATTVGLEIGLWIFLLATFGIAGIWFILSEISYLVGW